MEAPRLTDPAPYQKSVPSNAAVSPPVERRRIALLNQKGGVGKTTTTVNLGAALARRSKRVLFIDLDPQAHLTLHVGIDPDGGTPSVYDLLTNNAITAADVAQRVGDNLWILPAEVNLAGIEPELADRTARGTAQSLLRSRCEALLVEPPGFDFVLIDCPPSLGLLTINALSLAQEVLVPMQAHFLALQGLSKLLETIQLVKQSLNPNLVVSGVIPCMHEGQTILAAEVMADLKTFFDAARSLDVPWRHAKVLAPAIRRNIKLAEAPSFGKTIFDYAPDCHGAKDYESLAQAVLNLMPTASVPAETPRQPVTAAETA